MKGLPEALQRQYEYEDPIVRSGKHLMHSPFFKVGVLLLSLFVTIRKKFFILVGIFSSGTAHVLKI